MTAIRCLALDPKNMCSDNRANQDVELNTNDKSSP